MGYDSQEKASKKDAQTIQKYPNTTKSESTNGSQSTASRAKSATNSNNQVSH